MLVSWLDDHGHPADSPARELLSQALDVDIKATRALAAMLGVGGDVARVDLLRRMLVHDHRKIIVVDGHTAFIGGMNQGREYLYTAPYETGTLGSKEEPWEKWHDVHAQVRGPAVTELQQLFLDRWRVVVDEGPLPVAATNPPAGDLRLSVLATGPRAADDIGSRLLQAMSTAQRICIVNPFLIRRVVLEGLCARARAGAVVEVVVCGDHNDSKILQAYVRGWYDVLTEAGVDVRELSDRMTHAKVAVVDDSALIGSYNFNQRSANVDFEVALWVEDGTFAAEVRERVFSPLADCTVPVAGLSLGWGRREQSWLATQLVRAVPDLF